MKWGSCGIIDGGLHAELKSDGAARPRSCRATLDGSLLAAEKAASDGSLFGWTPPGGRRSGLLDGCKHERIKKERALSTF